MVGYSSWESLKRVISPSGVQLSVQDLGVDPFHLRHKSATEKNYQRRCVLQHIHIQWKEHLS